ncbi:MAG TPA: GNAT family N-acetyltransferase [Burkholderiales bacterium]|nr:GNAT family N-acetyltransferase [Burkholderiales bacterium]
MHERIARVFARHAGVRFYRFFKRPLDPAAPPAVPEGIDVRMLGAADLLPFCAQPRLDLAPAKLAAAFARGDLCAGAFDRGALVGYCWFAFSPLHHLDGVWVDFHPGGVWMYKSLVLPSHRGRGIARALYRFTDKPCVERGRSFSISCVETHNRSSIAAKRGTYAPAGYAAWLKRNDRVRTWRSPEAVRLGIRFYMPSATASRACLRAGASAL